MFKLVNRDGGPYGAFIITDDDDPAYADEVRLYGGRLVAESVSREFAPLLVASKLLYEACRAVIEHFNEEEQEVGDAEYWQELRETCDCSECEMLKLVKAAIDLVES